jgi:ribosome-associated heat shock protein Hsp15
LVYARLVRHRGDAQALIDQGHVRLNKQRVTKSSHQARPGDILTLTLYSGVKVLRIAAEPERRGPASATTSLYEIVESQSQKEDATGSPIC